MWHLQDDQNPGPVSVTNTKKIVVYSGFTFLSTGTVFGMGEVHCFLSGMINFKNRLLNLTHIDSN